MSLLETLRTPRIKGIAVFDVGGTALIGYYIANKMNWNKPTTIGSLFVIGYLTHEVLGIEIEPQSKFTNSLS